MAKTDRSKFSEADGWQLAADMLREVHQEWRDSDDENDRDDAIDDWKRSDPKVLRRYIANVLEKGSPELERGFFQVLSDFVGSSSEGSPSPEFYEKQGAQ